MRKRYFLLFLFVALLIVSFIAPGLLESYGMTTDVRDTVLGSLAVVQLIVFARLGYLQWQAERAELLA